MFYIENSLMTLQNALKKVWTIGFLEAFGLVQNKVQPNNPTDKIMLKLSIKTTKYKRKLLKYDNKVMVSGDECSSLLR